MVRKSRSVVWKQTTTFLLVLWIESQRQGYSCSGAAWIPRHLLRNHQPPLETRRGDTTRQPKGKLVLSRPARTAVLCSHDERERLDSAVPHPPAHDLTQRAATTSRRQYLEGVVQTVTAAAATWGTLRSRPAWAATNTAVLKYSPPKLISSPAVCDETVTVWKRGDRFVYLLGTAHISQVSADLAAQLVRDIHPNAVFVELDLKRIGGGLAASRGAATTTRLSIQMSDGSTSNLIVPNVDNYVPRMTSTSATLPSSSSSTSTSSTLSQSSSLFPFESETDGSLRGGGLFGGAALRFGAAAIGNAIRGMYSNLNQAGFNPGEEFVAAIREGQKVGADIVLGDRDVEVTLQRLTQALAVTDLEKMMNPDSDFERSMKELMPGAESTAALPSDDPTKFKEEMSTFVENLKSRDKVRRIIGELEQVAPALVHVMLTERNAYMAAGLDTLNQFDVIVAVMGLAHADGVEQNLRDLGWRQVFPNCKQKRR